MNTLLSTRPKLRLEDYPDDDDPDDPALQPCRPAKPAPPRNTVACRITLMRHLHGLRRGEIEKLAGLKRGHLNHIEDGSRIPTLETLGAIVDAFRELGTDLSYEWAGRGRGHCFERPFVERARGDELYCWWQAGSRAQREREMDAYERRLARRKMSPAEEAV